MTWLMNTESSLINEMKLDKDYDDKKTNRGLSARV